MFLTREYKIHQRTDDYTGMNLLKGNSNLWEKEIHKAPRSTKKLKKTFHSTVTNKNIYYSIVLYLTKIYTIDLNAQLQ